MRYATLDNGIIHYAPRMLVDRNTKVFNPLDSMYIEHGYLPVMYTDAPETDEQHYAVYSWEEQDGVIVQVWSLEEIPVNDEATETDYITALQDLGVEVE